MRDLTNEREAALTAAVTVSAACFTGGPEADRELLATATGIFDWLVGPVALYVAIGEVLDQGTKEPTGTPTGGNAMQLHDTEQVDLTVSVSDVKGATVGDDPGTTTDDLTWTIDNPTAASLTVSPDTRTCTVIAGTVGSGVITVTLGELSATLAVDVIPGAASKIEISEGAPTPQPVA